MFYLQEEIESKLICIQCKKRFGVPKFLPCGETLCGECVNAIELRNNSIKCPHCGLLHVVPSAGEFPTQKLIVELLNIAPRKVYRGYLHEATEILVQEIDEIIASILSENYEFKIDGYFLSVSGQIEADDSIESSGEKDSWLREVESFKKQCLSDFKTKSLQKEQALSFIGINRKRLVSWKDELSRIDYNSDDRWTSISESANVMKQVIHNCIQFYDSLHFLGKQLQYVYNAEKRKSELVYKDYTYHDILNFDRLKSLRNDTSAIDYTPLCCNSINQTVHGIWLSLFSNERLVVCFDLFDKSAKRNQINMTLMDDSGKLLKENNAIVNCELITIATCATYLVAAVRNSLLSQYQVHLYDLLLNNEKTIEMDFQPLMIHHTIIRIYVLSNEAPFIHVYDLNLKQIDSFGQDTDENADYYMANVIQIYVRNDVVYIRDSKNAYIRALDLQNGKLVKLININLHDSLLHIDSIGRIIVVNKDSKILYLFNEEAEILFEYDLTFMHTISTFCVINNGHLLINDVKNKLLHIR